jgi:hypothetical protein
LSIEEPQFKSPNFSRQAASQEDGNLLPLFGQANPSRVKQPDLRSITSRAQIEHPGILQKKLTLFREEKGETGQVDLLLVYFGFGEVRSDRDIQGQVGSETIFEILQPDAGLIVG